MAAAPASVWHSRALARAASGPPLRGARSRTAAHWFLLRTSTPSTSGARSREARARCMGQRAGVEVAGGGGGGGVAGDDGTHLGEASLAGKGDDVTTAQLAPPMRWSRWSSGSPGCVSVKARQRDCALTPLPSPSVSASTACACSSTSLPCEAASNCSATSASNSQLAGSRRRSPARGCGVGAVPTGAGGGLSIGTVSAR